MSTREICADCRTPLPSDASGRLKYCSKRCADRAAQRRKRAGNETESDASRLKRLLVEQTETIQRLEGRVGQRAAQVQWWKQKAHRLRLKVGRQRRDLERARMTVGTELVLVREALARREAESPSSGTVVDAQQSAAKLRQENERLRTALQQSQQSAATLRATQDDYLVQIASLNDEAELQQSLLERMKIKSDLMFRVFEHWNIIAGWLFDQQQDGEDTPDPESVDVVVRFWLWVHQTQPHIIQRGRIETSYDDELQESNL